MTAILRNESRNLLHGTLLLCGMFAIILVFVLGVFPGIKEEAETLQEAFPGYFVALLGFEELHTLEGYTAGYVYPLILVVFVGVYVAYVSATMINADIRSRKMDLILSNPVSRESVVIQKFGALWVPVIFLNLSLFIILLIGSVILGESIDPIGLLLVHVLVIPYLLVCGGIGLVLSVLLSRESSAEGGALGLVFVLWLLDGIAEMDDMFAVVGVLTPSRYYDPTAILVHEQYAFFDAFVLLIVAMVLLGVSIVLFVRRDI